MNKLGLVSKSRATVNQLELRTIISVLFLQKTSDESGRVYNRDDYVDGCGSTEMFSLVHILLLTTHDAYLFMYV